MSNEPRIIGTRTFGRDQDGEPILAVPVASHTSPEDLVSTVVRLGILGIFGSAQQTATLEAAHSELRHGD